MMRPAWKLLVDNAEEFTAGNNTETTSIKEAKHIADNDSFFNIFILTF